MKSWNRWTEEEKEILKRHYASDSSDKLFSLLGNRHRGTIYWKASQLGLRREHEASLRDFRKTYNKQWLGKHRKVQECKTLYLSEELSTTQIAQRMNLGASTVRRWLKKTGVNLRKAEQSRHLRRIHGEWKPSVYRPPKGKDSHNWKGGRPKSGKYILQYAPQHYRALKNGYVMEHILVWEEANGQRLPDGWVVHHLNGIGSDNRPENLVGLPSREHACLLAKMAERIRELEKLVKPEQIDKVGVLEIEKPWENG